MSGASGLDRDTLLVRASDLVLHLTDDDDVTLELAGEKIRAPKVAVAILDAFAQPRRLGDVLPIVSPQGVEQFIEASSVVLQLERAGALHPPGARSRPKSRGYVKPSIHIAMLDDHVRTRKFCEAIRARVQSSDVVVDIGTGTGVLATCAALAGARRVFAMESTAIADVAARVFAANGVDDRVVLVRDRSTHASIPERADLLVTEMIGNDPLDERIIEVVADARARLLRPGAHVIPSRLEIVACAVDIPEDVFHAHVFTSARVAGYEEASGVALGALLDHRLGASKPIMRKTRDVTAWPPVAPSVRIANLDLEGETPETFETKARFEVAGAVERFGVFLAFRAELADGIVLSTVPGEVDAANHWRFALWPAIDLGPLSPHDAVDVHYHYERGTSTVRFARA